MNAIEQKDLEINKEILERRMESLSSMNPKVGDWVIFNNCERRISYIWNRNEYGDISPVAEWGIQTSSPCASYYLGNGYVSFSGSLFVSVKGGWLQWSGEQKDANVWFFNRDHWSAHCGRTFQAAFEVWTVDQDAPEY